MTDQAATPSIPAGFSSIVELTAREFERAFARVRPEPSRSFLIGTRDGVRIQADVFLPTAHPPIAKLLIAPAMGVKRQFYAAFAAEMATHGIASMTFDYRGVGGSLEEPIHECEAHLAQWGEQDMAAATRELEALTTEDGDPRYAKLPLLFVGHSVGGQLLGLMPENPYRSALFVGSQSGSWRHWDGPSRAVMAALWYVGVPVLTGALGYLPMKAMGQGENIPRGVAREWARWGRDRAYIGVRIAESPNASFNHWSGNVRALAIADDAYAPLRAVTTLTELYRKASSEVMTIHPRDVGVKAIGHFGWFKKHHQATLWADARRWLLASAGVNPGGSGPA
jgi:predicted alpha/beta hydrolase